jgi:cysteine-rich repeat protein
VLTRCGNGHLELGEECDDGNRIDTDGGTSYCKKGPYCGDGITQLTRGETCEPSRISRVAMIVRDAGIVSCRLGTGKRATAPINPLVALIARVVGMASCRMIKVSSATLLPSYPRVTVGYAALLVHGHHRNDNAYALPLFLSETAR